jgi:hypothetical protein
MVATNKSSPYSKTPLVNGYLGILNPIDIPAEFDDVSFTITSKYLYRPDLLAHDLYNDSRLWWVFASRNKEVIKDSIYDFVTGQTIFLPKLATIKKAIGNP